MPTSGLRELDSGTTDRACASDLFEIDKTQATHNDATHNGATPEQLATPGQSIVWRSRNWASRHLVLTLMLATGAVVRIMFAVGFDGPAYTNDLMRGVLTGRAVWHHGIRTAGRPLVETFPWATENAGVPWSHLPYNYPPVSVGFFSFVAAIGGGTVLAKLLLTVSDAVCAWLIVRLTGRRSFGLVYWISPIAMWWTSHEGQFETLQSMLGLGALATMQLPVVSGVLIALAVQTKLTAAALVPFLAWSMRKHQRLRSFVIGGMIGSVPTVVLSFLYPIIPNVFRYSAQFRWNPYYWNPVDPTHQWSKQLLTMRVLPQMVSVLFFVWVVVVARDRTLRAQASAAVGFAMFMKFYSQIPSWYLITLPLMLVPLVLKAQSRPRRGDPDPTAVSMFEGEASPTPRTRLTRPSAITWLTFLWMLAFSVDAVTLRQMSGTL